MFNSAIFWKTARDSAAMLIFAAIAIAGFVVLFTWSMVDMGEELMAFVQKFEFLKKIFEFGLGIDVSGDVSINVLLSACFTHAMVFILSWSFIISTTSRVTVGEVERGTADLLLTLPVNRHEVYFSTSLVWILAAVILAFCPIVGIWIGTQILTIEGPIELSKYVAPAINSLCLLWAIGGISSMVSSILNRRGLAIALVSGFLIVSAMLNFVEAFIEAIQRIRFIGMLSYFRPVDVVRNGEWPITHMFVLLGIAITCWVVGLVVFCKKDIPTA